MLDQTGQGFVRRRQVQDHPAKATFGNGGAPFLNCLDVAGQLRKRIRLAQETLPNRHHQDVSGLEGGRILDYHFTVGRRAGSQVSGQAHRNLIILVQ